MSSQTTPTLTEGLQLIFQSMLADSIHTCMPGVIISYDSKKRKAEVLPEITKKYLDGEEVKYQPIPEVPVISFITGKSGIRLPEKEYVKQTCLLLFSERAMDSWLLKDGENPPIDRRKFDLTDAICIVGLNNFVDVNDDKGGPDLSMFFNDTDITIKENGDLQLNGNTDVLVKSGGEIVIEGGNKIIVKANGDIELGSAALKNLINDSFKSKFDSHVHNFIAAPSGTFSTSRPANLIAGTLPTPVGGIPAPFGVEIIASEITSKVSAE